MRLSEDYKTALVQRHQNGESATDICIKEGVAKSTFYSWAKKYATETNETGTVISPYLVYRMKQRITKLEEMVDVLQKVNCTATAPLQARLLALEPLWGQYSVRVLCESLKVDRGTFYNHVKQNKKNNSSYALRRAELREHIINIHADSQQIYGPKKIKAVLEQQGIITSDRMVAELMQEMNLQSIRTDSKRTYKRLQKEGKHDAVQLHFRVNRPNEVWVSDITYFKVGSKFYHICVILDLYARKAIAANISAKASTQLVTSTFRAAYREQQPTEHLIFHSDRGVQYTAYAFQKILREYRIEQSFSPSGSPQHNAVMESFFASMKREELYRRNYRSLEEFKKGVFRYIQFYNQDRPHSTIKYKTPNAYEDLFFQNQ